MCFRWSYGSMCPNRKGQNILGWITSIINVTLSITDAGLCAGNPCKNGGNCTEEDNDFQCDCVAGYTGKDCSLGKNQ